MNEKLRRIWRVTDRKKRIWERYFITRTDRALKEQVKPVIEALSNQTGQEVINNIPQLISKDPVTRLFYSLYERVAVSFAKDQVRELKGVEMALNTKSELIADPDQLENIWLETVRHYISTTAGARIISITDTSRDEAIKILQSLIDKAVAEGMGIPETTRMLRREFPIEWRKLSWRAELIARTEILTASNQGAYIGAKATGLDLKKVWIARLDGRERPWHAEANGKEIDMDNYFMVGGYSMSKPGDPAGGAANVCNCRCTVAFIRNDRLED